MKNLTRDKMLRCRIPGNRENVRLNSPKNALVYTWFALINLTARNPLWLIIAISWIAIFKITGITADMTLGIDFTYLLPAFEFILILECCILQYLPQRHATWFRIDKYGISELYKDKFAKYNAIEEDTWKQISQVRVYRHFMAITICYASGHRNTLILTTKAPKAAIKSITYYWNLAARGFFDKDIPDAYTATEQKEICKFIERQFGRQVLTIYDDCDEAINVDLAIIRPDDDHPYYTICTIGAGAYRINAANVNDDNKPDTRYYEYMVHLPPEWHIGRTVSSDDKMNWPLAMLRKLGNKWLSASNKSLPYGSIALEYHLSPHTKAQGMYFCPPLQQPDSFPVADLSTGCSVAFTQVIFLTEEEAKLTGKSGTPQKHICNLFGIDKDELNTRSPKERQHIIAKLTIDHMRTIMGMGGAPEAQGPNA